MKKSLIIIILICSLAILPILVISFNISKIVSNTKGINKFNSQVTNMYISNNDEIFVEQTIDVKNCIPTDNNSFEEEIFNFYVPFYNVNNYEIYSIDIRELKSNISMFNQLEHRDKYSYRENINIKRLKIDKTKHSQLIKELERENYKIKFSYKIDSKIILSYSDNKKDIILNLKGNNKFYDCNVLYIHLPNNTQILNKEKYIELQKNNIYKINLKRKNIDYEIQISGDLKNEINSKSFDTRYKHYRDANIILKLFTTITGIFGVIVCIVYILKRAKIKKGIYEREPKNVIEPIFAESIIDGQIDAKDLIMTCLVNLIYKKKIENIDNDSLKLIDVTELSDIERKVLSMLFDTTYPIEYCKGKVVKLSALNNIFKKENKKSLNVNTRFIEIKQIIKNQLYELKILNKIWDIVLNQIKILSFLNILNLIILLGLGVEDVFDKLKGSFMLPILFMNILAYVMQLNKGVIYIMKIETTRKKGYVAIMLLMSIFMVIIGLADSLSNIDMEMLIYFIILIIANIVIFKLSNTYVLTKKGKEEYKKAYMLKKYLIEYSLIEQRDIDGLIIFDDYLVYATAFGIPSKITSKIRENMLSLNIKLQVISKLLTL